MKKMIPALAVLAGAAAMVAYKLKKDEEKQIVDLDQGLLEDEDDASEMPEETTENPTDDSASDMETVREEARAAGETLKEKAEDVIEKGKEWVKDATEELKDTAEDAKKVMQEATEDVDEEFPALLKSEVQTLKEQAQSIMEAMLKEGDVHENERPVQHTVVFQNGEDLESFKNEVINRGFVVTRGDGDHELVVLHITPIDDIKLMGNVLYIASEAKRHHGEYRGWNSKIIY